MPTGVTISLTSPDGSHQAGLMANRDANTWTEQIGADYSGALLTAFCGQPVAPAAARPVAAAMAMVMPSLQRAG
jgi:hypothetical protein